MNHKDAEKLLSALVFDDLDEASKNELTAYLQTDDELRERLTDMRMAAKVTSDALHHGPDPVLNKRRLKRLAGLAKHSRQPVVFTARYMAAAAAILIAIMLPSFFLFTPSLSKVTEHATQLQLGADHSRVAAKASRDLAGGNSAGYDTEFTGGRVQEDISFSIKTDAYGKTEESLEGKGIAAGIPGQGELTFGYRDEPVIYSVSGSGVGGTGGGMGGMDISGDRGGASSGWRESNSRTNGDESRPSEMSRFYSNALTGEPEGEPSPATVSSSTPFDPQIPTPKFAGTPKNINGREATVRAGDELTVDYAYRRLTEVQDKKPAAPKKSPRPRPAAKPAVIIKPEETPPPQIAALGSEPESQMRGTIKTGSDALELSRLKASDKKGVNGRKLNVDSYDTLEIAQKEITDLTEKDLVSKTRDNRLAGEVDDSDFGGSMSGKVPILGDISKTGALFKDEGKGQIKDGKDMGKEVERQVEKQPQQAVDDYLKRATNFMDEMRYEEAVGQLDQLLTIEKTNPQAIRLNKVLKDTLTWQKQLEMQKKVNKEEIKRLLEAGETLTSYSELIQYYGTEVPEPPKNWAELVKQREQESEGKKIPVQGDISKTGAMFEAGGKEQIKVGKDMGSVNGVIVSSGGPVVTDDEAQTGLGLDVDGDGVQRGFSMGLRYDAPVSNEEIGLPLASGFKSVPVNPWVMSKRDRLSTFALDVDTASYTLSRRYIYNGFLPPAGAVRMEEFINYFNYQYPQSSNRTFTVHAEAAASPFAGRGKNLTLLKVGVKARTIGRDQQKPAHLILVIDSSASMGKPDRLGLVQQSLNLLIDKLSASDRVTLITCANESRLHLEAASLQHRDKIRQAINAIQPSGATNLLAGLKLGYAIARRSFDAKQINHIVLCSDGVANVGQTEADVVLREVDEDRKQGITITCVGVGHGSYNDVFMESLANHGDGSYVFLDSARQGQKVFVEQLAATMHVVAKDARIQVSFNPNRVRRYRLIGYENRDIEDKRFRDDTVDAGEVGSGQCSTALYELELTDHLSSDRREGLGTVFVRYRDADTDRMDEISYSLKSSIVQKRKVESSPRFFLAAAASQFAEILRQSEHARNGSMKEVLAIAEKVSLALPLDRDVRELIELIRKAEHLPRAQ